MVVQSKEKVSETLNKGKLRQFNRIYLKYFRFQSLLNLVLLIHILEDLYHTSKKKKYHPKEKFAIHNACMFTTII